MQQEKETRVTFAQNLRRLMTERGIKNPAQLAKQAGLTHVAVGNYLNKGRIPDTDALFKLCKFFQVSMDELTNGPAPNISLHTADALMDEFVDVAPEKRAAFERYVESLLRPGRRMVAMDKKLTEIRSLLAQIITVIDDGFEPEQNFLPQDVASNQRKTAPKAQHGRLHDDDTVSLHIYGNIPAGFPQDNDGAVIPIRTVQVQRGQFPEGVFGLVVRGDSMNLARPGPILDGETVVLVSPEQREPRSGDIVAALIDGETTLKRLVNGDRPAHLVSESSNSAFGKIYPRRDLLIQGVYVGKL